jgi:aryl-alcohol dehydrogenase-like predicted oxidoreductase
MSEVSPAEVEAARKIVPVVTVQNRYSLGDRRHEDMLNWCEQQGIGFMPWYPMNAGKLMKSGQPVAQPLAEHAAKHGVSVAQLSLAWLLQRSPVVLPIPGTSKVAHLEENVSATSLNLSPGDWKQIENAART